LSPVYEAPRPIRPGDAVESFCCGKAPLDDWLRRHALGNEGRTSRTYVVSLADKRDGGAIVAYYALATGAVRLAELPNSLRRNVPPVVPVMVLGRLAVDVRHSGRGLGSDLLWDAMRRTLEVSRIAGVRALLAHAIDDEVVGFYARYGFRPFPAGGRTLFLQTEEIAAAFA
jgi:GNAT superfamily N-acetyltransferase